MAYRSISRRIPRTSPVRARRIATSIRRDYRARVAALAIGAAVLLACGVNPKGTMVADTSLVLGALSDRMARAGGQTYTADYGVSGGGRVRLAHDRREAAVIGPRGRFAVTADHLLLCDSTGCRRAPNRGQRLGRDTATLVDSVTGSVFASPELVQGAVAAAALAPKARVATTTRQIAGVESECGDVTGLGGEEFMVCLSDEGVLTLFRGRLPDGRAAELELTGLRRSVDAADLAAPAGTPITDVPTLS